MEAQQPITVSNLRPSIAKINKQRDKEVQKIKYIYIYKRDNIQSKLDYKNEMNNIIRRKGAKYVTINEHVHLHM